MFVFLLIDVTNGDYAIDENDSLNKLKVGVVGSARASISKRSQLAKLSKFDAKKPVQVDESAQLLIDYIANYLDIRYDVVSNEGGRFHVDITLANTGTREIQPCCFSIVFAHMKYALLFNSTFQYLYIFPHKWRVKYFI